MSDDGVSLIVILVYSTYFLLAAVAARLVWQKTRAVEEPRRGVLRSLAFAALFAPALAGTRVAPFLLAVMALVVSDLLFVHPLTLSWAAQAFSLFVYYMLLPFLVTWVVLLSGIALLRRARREK